MSARRSSGVLLPLFSLPGGHGIGDMGPGAYAFIDWLVRAGQRLWHLLPLAPVLLRSYSPYSAASAMAGEPLLISLELLRDEGLLDRSDLAHPPGLSRDRVAYGQVVPFKHQLLTKAWRRFAASPPPEFGTFCEEHGEWLDDFALYWALCRHHKTSQWIEWPSAVRTRKPEALERAREELRDEYERTRFVQYVFYRQWKALRAYARKRNVHLIGDIPLFVSYASCDVWRKPALWKLGPDLRPRVEAGVPPLGKGDRGQRWGMPVYDWSAHQAEGFAWWLRRIDRCSELYDWIRFDHFRGLLATWEVPVDAPSPRHGHYEDVPGDELLGAILRRLGHLPLLPEVLGDITPAVLAMVDRWDLPHMRVLLGAFGGDYAQSLDAPHNYPARSIAFTGNHDMEPARGWFRHADDRTRQNLARTLGHAPKDGSVHRDLARLVLLSVAEMAIVPLQDVVGLDESARINTPGTRQRNWQWRATALPGAGPTDWLRGLTELAGRA